MRPVAIGALALSIMGGSFARAQGVDDFAGLLAAFEEHFGQSVGEAMVGGQSVFVTAKGVAKIDKPVGRTYGATVEGVAETAVEAAKIRDAKLDKVRALAKRFATELTLGEANYVYGPHFTPPARIVQGSPPPLPAPVRTPSSTFTVSTPVRFSRLTDAGMPTFLDALHEAGIDNFSNTSAPTNIFSQATETFGFGTVGGDVDQATWDKAMAAAVSTAKLQAETLASAGGRHVGDLRQVMLLSKSVRGNEATVTVAARFGFAK